MLLGALVVTPAMLSRLKNCCVVVPILLLLLVLLLLLLLVRQFRGSKNHGLLRGRYARKLTKYAILCRMCEVKQLREKEQLRQKK